jgi:hypothetical protein
VKSQEFMGKTNFFLSTLPFNPWAILVTWLHGVRSSSKNIGKLSLILVFNKTSPRAHMESELDVLGVHGKLVKYVVHLSKRKNRKKKILFFTQAAQTAIYQFLVSRNFRG